MIVRIYRLKWSIVRENSHSLFGMPWPKVWKEIVREASGKENVDADHLLELIPAPPEPISKEAVKAHEAWFNQLPPLLENDQIDLAEGRAIQEVLNLMFELSKMAVFRRMNN
jgi:hypothetical protein